VSERDASLFLMVVQEAVSVGDAGVAEEELALMTVPLRVSSLLRSSLVPAVPAPATDCSGGGSVLSLHWEMEQGEVCGRSCYAAFLNENLPPDLWLALADIYSLSDSRGAVE
jgi:hypothetical protein